MTENYRLIRSDGGSCEALTYDSSFSPVFFFINTGLGIDFNS